MSFARNIIRDLVQKRLWPVALLMAVAIVAIPLLGGGVSSSKSTSSDETLPLAPGPATAASAVELIGPPTVHQRAGKLVDPFRRKPKKAEETTTTPSAGATADTTSSTPSTPSTTEPTPTTPKPSLSVYRTTVRWSEGDAPAKSRRISRLTPLGGLLDPAVLYLGVSKDGKHALFLLGPNATSVGEAKCREATCRVISLGEDDTQIVDLKPADSAPRQFQLEIVSVKSHKLSNAAEAAKARRKVHPDGRDVLSEMLQDAPTLAAAGGFGYDRLLGVIVKVDSSTTTGGKSTQP